MTGAAAVEGFVLAAGLIVAIGAQNAFVLRRGLKREHVLAKPTVCWLSDCAAHRRGRGGHRLRGTKDRRRWPSRWARPLHPPHPPLGWTTRSYMKMEPATVVRALCPGRSRTITWQIAFGPAAGSGG